MPVKAELPIRKVARRAGMVALGVIAVDIVASIITLALGWSMIRR